MEEYRIDKALNIRVSKDHLDKNRQKQMIGLFKHNAYQLGLTQAEYFAHIISGVYETKKLIESEMMWGTSMLSKRDDVLGRIKRQLPNLNKDTMFEELSQQEEQQMLLDEIMGGI